MVNSLTASIIRALQERRLHGFTVSEDEAVSSHTRLPINRTDLIALIGLTITPTDIGSLNQIGAFWSDSGR